MRLAIADPPYLGRADRWYGDGRGSGKKRATGGRDGRKPDYHPNAAAWDQPEEHARLVERLTADFDGWAIAGASDYVRLLLEAAPAAATLGIWHRPNAMPGGGRLLRSWEPVVFLVPESRRDRASGITVRDVLTEPVRQQGFLGSKPPAWTAWVLNVLGYNADTDTITDLFPGSGAVANAAAQGALNLGAPA